MGTQGYVCLPSKKARSIHAIFSCLSMSPIRKSFVPMSPYFSATASRSIRNVRMIASRPASSAAGPGLKSPAEQENPGFL